MGKSSVGNFVANGGATGMLLGGRGDGGAGAAQAAAMAQQRQAQANYNETSSIINPASVQALQSLDRDIANQDKNLGRQEQLVSQIDPTIIEASQQALKLLRGEQSSTLAPAQQQRSLQRQKLVNTLREQMGPGAETSTAGMQALSNFDMQTNSLMAGQQQSALANLGNISSQFSAQRPDMFREIMGSSGLAQNRFGIAQSQAAALGNARMGLQQTAGAEFTGDAVRGRQQQAQFGQLMQLGGTAAGFALGGPMGGAAGSQLGGALGGGPTPSAGGSYNGFGNYT